MGVANKDECESSDSDDGDISDSNSSSGSDESSSNVDDSDGVISENEMVRLNREKNVHAMMDQDRPLCQICRGEIAEAKKSLICKGACKGMFHFDCALK